MTRRGIYPKGQDNIKFTNVQIVVDPTLSPEKQYAKYKIQYEMQKHAFDFQIALAKYMDLLFKANAILNSEEIKKNLKK